jgi:hypothetical protein
MVRGRVFKKDAAQYIEDASLIRYLKSQSNFHVVELADLNRVPPQAPASQPVQQAQQKLPAPPPPPPKVVPQEDSVERRGVLEVVPAEVTQAPKTEGPEPLERTPVKPIQRTPRIAKGRKSFV